MIILDRFINAQEGSYSKALKEIENGRKLGHWIWYVFPQVEGLGRSHMSEYYAIKSKDEALVYLEHPVLGARLIEISSELLKHRGQDIRDIVGFVDARKVKSAMTLFSAVQSEEKVFDEVLKEFYHGDTCKRTLKWLG